MFLHVYMCLNSNLPSGYVKIAMENGPVEIVSFPMKNGGSFHSFLYVYQAGSTTKYSLNATGGPSGPITEPPPPDPGPSHVSIQSFVPSFACQKWWIYP